MTDQRDSRQEEEPLKFELIQADDYGKYLLHSRTEILFLLRALQEKGALITVYFNQGTDFLLTSIVSVAADGSRMVLDYGSSKEMNHRALAADRLVCITSHDKVKVQFILRGVEKIQFQGRDAFCAKVPDTVLRLQRREYYRLTAPVARPLKCFIPVPQPDGGRTVIEANVLDISGGGVAVMVPQPGIEFEVDSTFTDCRLELPEMGTLTTTLRVRNLFEITLRNGTRSKRYGCQFIDLPGAMVNLIQRYIIKVERERKARESGLI
ncbi:MAG: flagellar brake protein [Pseudomonadota bacterium]|jgi:c-di-GMP-binding flagellar brake protein YcgR